MNKLLHEQFRLHFGEDWKETSKQAKSYVAFISQSSWLEEDQRKRLFTAEGGREGLFFLALSHIIEAEDLKQGLKNLSSYIAASYINRSESRTVSLDAMSACDSVVSSPTLGEWWSNLQLDIAWHDHAAESSQAFLQRSSDESFSDSALASQAAYASKMVAVGFLLKNPDEHRLFEVYARTGSLPETAELLGLTYSEARKIYKRVLARKSPGQNAVSGA